MEREGEGEGTSGSTGTRHHCTTSEETGTSARSTTTLGEPITERGEGTHYASTSRSLTCGPNKVQAWSDAGMDRGGQRRERPGPG